MRRCRGTARVRTGPLLDEYTGAFSRYLRTGEVGTLFEFCAEDADPARLRVYRNGFLKACIEALRANYPSVERLVGEERFAALARPYVDAHPPRTAGLVEYGEGFPKFIEDTSDTHRLAYLASFAVLDRAWSEVYFAEDADVPAAAAGTALSDGVSGDAGTPVYSGQRPVPPEGRPVPKPNGSDEGGPASGLPADPETLMNLRGRLSPRVRMVSLDYHVLDAWSRLRQGGLGDRTEIRPVAQQILIWRDGAQVLYRDLARPEHVFLACVAVGQSCGEAAGAALDIDAGFDLVAAFASLLHHRILTFEH